MSSYAQMCVVILTLACLLTFSIASLADEPPDNTIPIIGMFFTWWKWSPELLCEMSWMHFDGIEYEVFISQEGYIENLMATVDSSGMMVILSPAELNLLAAMGNDSCRGHYLALSGDSAFIEVNATGSLVEGVYSDDATEAFIESICEDFVDTIATPYDDQIWFYRYFDEPASNQRAHQYDTRYAFDDYFPSYLADDSTFRAD